MKLTKQKIRRYRKDEKAAILERAKRRDKKRVFLRNAGIGFITLLLTLVVYNADQAGQWFKASVLEAPQPFNGTVLPVSKVPNWTHWEGDHYTAHYSSISENDLISLPQYDLNKMQFPDDQLQWGNSSHDDIRNTKITYSVVYLGNYKLEHHENKGSHPAIDIKMPQGTPIHAIANGKVVKVSNSSSGFGHHIVIQHPNAPHPQNPGQLTTLYSSYAHMDELQVNEGQNVIKGQVIGTSGNTGTSTTPHLHFQIDLDSAPWHPYWPFSWSEAQEAGLSFFEAVNAALGIDKAKTHTINPMDYVYSNINTNVVASGGNSGINNPASDSSVDSGTDTVAVAEDATTDEGVEIVDNPFEESEVQPENVESQPGADPNLFEYKLVAESVAKVGTGLPITVIDETGQLDDLPDDAQIRADVSGGSLIKKVFTKSDFKNGTITLVAKSDEPGTVSVSIGRSHHFITFVENAGGTATFNVEHDGHFQQNVPEELRIVAADLNGNPTGVASFSGAVDIMVKEGNAVVTPNRITAADFKSGVATVQLKVPSSERVVIRAQQGAIVGESDPITKEGKNLFTDIHLGHNNYEAIKFLKNEGIISGYPDGSFKPNKTVNRVEALKMLMLAFDINPGVSGPLPFNDTDNSAWYSNTVAAALNKKIVQGYPDGSFKPANTVNRAELLKMLFNTADTDLPAVDVNPYQDVPVGAWYAPYAYVAKKKNVVDAVDQLRPSDGMTRAAVAEAIYRMRKIKDLNLVTYSK